jgi:hypothetical protein
VWAAALVRAPVGVGGSSGSFLSVDHAERIGKGGQQARVKSGSERALGRDWHSVLQRHAGRRHVVEQTRSGAA